MFTVVAASTTVGIITAIGSLICVIVAGALLVKDRKEKKDKEN